MATSQAMKVTLCHSSQLSREVRPPANNTTPVAKTASVDPTRSGAIPRMIGCGGPFSR
jgi:hypothetical protein